MSDETRSQHIVDIELTGEEEVQKALGALKSEFAKIRKDVRNVTDTYKESITPIKTIKDAVSKIAGIEALITTAMKEKKITASELVNYEKQIKETAQQYENILKKEIQLKKEALATQKKATEELKKQSTEQVKKTSATKDSVKENQKITDQLKRQSEYDSLLSMTAVKRATGYFLLFNALNSIKKAMSEAVDFAKEYNKTLLLIEAVIDVSAKQAKVLEDRIVGLSMAYGENLSSLNQVVLELGRAGVAYKDLGDATKVVTQLAILTGDTVEVSASAMVTYLQVFSKDNFGKAIASVEDLGAKLAYMANASRMSTQDIGTMSNYALASAKAIGMTVDQVNALAVSMSNAGKNASTIGTNIRRFTTIMSEDSEAIDSFFTAIGINQDNLRAKFAKGGKESNEAFMSLLKTLKGYSKESLNEVLSGMNILTRDTLQTIINTNDEMQVHFRKSLNITRDEINKADKVTESLERRFKSLSNTISSESQGAIDSGLSMIVTTLELITGLTSDAVSGIKSIGSAMGLANSDSDDLRDMLKGMEYSIAQVAKLNQNIWNVDDLDKYKTRVSSMLETTQAILTKTQTMGDIDLQRSTLRRFNELRKLKRELDSITEVTDKPILSDKQIETMTSKYNKQIESLKKNIDTISSADLPEDVKAKRIEYFNTMISKQEELRDSLGKTEIALNNIAEPKKVFKKYTEDDSKQIEAILQRALKFDKIGQEGEATAQIDFALEQIKNKIEQATPQLQDSMSKIFGEGLSFEGIGGEDLDSTLSQVKDLSATLIQKQRELVSLGDDATESDKQQLNELNKTIQSTDLLLDSLLKINETKVKINETDNSASRNLARQIKAQLDLALATAGENDMLQTITEAYQEKATIIDQTRAKLSAIKDDTIRNAEIAKLDTELQKEYNKYLEDRVKLEEQIRDILLENQQSIIDAQNALNDGVINWASGLDGVAGKLGGIAKATADMGKLDIKAKTARNKLDDKYYKLALKAGNDEVAIKKLQADYEQEKGILEQQSVQDQLQGYSQLAGAMSGMFEEGSREAAAFRAVQDGLALSAAITAIASAGMGDPYTAIPRIIAMTATMASLLTNIGQTINGGGSSTSYGDSFASKDKTSASYYTELPSGSIYDERVDRVYDNISESLSILEEYAEPQYDVLNKMYLSINALSTSISGLAKQAVSIASGGDLSSYQETSVNNVSGVYGGELVASILTNVPILTLPYVAVTYGDFVDDVTGFVDDTLDNIFGGSDGGLVGDIVGGGLNLIFGGWADDLVGGLFGSEKKSLKDYGVKINEQLIGTALEGIEGSFYQTIKTKKSSGFGLISSSEENTKLLDMDEQVNQDITKVIASIYDNTIQSAEALGFNAVEVAKDLSDAQIQELGISYAQTEEEIQEQLTGLFSGIAETLAVDALNGLIDQYRDAGEEFGTAINRIATETNVSLELLKMTGIELENRVEAITVTLGGLEIPLGYENKAIDITQSLIELSGGFDKFSTNISSYYDNYFTDVEKLANTQRQVDTVFKDLNITTPKTREEFRNIVEGLDLTTETGRKTYVKLLGVSEAFNILGEEIDKVADEAKSLQQSVFDMIATDNEKRAATLLGLNESNRIYQEFMYAIEDAQKAQEEQTQSFIDAKELEKKAYEDTLNETEKYISTLEQAFDSIQSTIDKLKGSLLGSEYTLENFARLMRETIALSTSEDYEGYAESLKKTISASSALFDEANFEYERDMKFAQAVATNQFEMLENTTQTQIDYLKIIAENTEAQIYVLAESIEKLGQSFSTGTQTLINQVAASNPEYQQVVNDAKDSQLATGDFADRIYGAYRAITGRTPDAEGLDYWLSRADLESANTTELYTAIARGANNEPDVYKAVKWLAENTNSSYGQNLAAKSADAGIISQSAFLDMVYKYGLGVNPDTEGKNYWLGLGLSAAELLTRFPRGAEVAGMTYNSFAVGTPNVPYDMTANIHKGEMIVPQTFSEGLRRGDLMMGSQQEVVAEMRALREENKQMRSIMLKLANNSDRANELSNESLATLQSIEEAS